MKLLPRIIPTLLLKDGGLVKGVKFKNHVYVGDPINAVKIYNDKEVDELCLLNIAPANKQDPIPFSLIERIASEAFMPFSYGGNINTLEDIQILINLGVEKIVLNTAIFSNKKLIKEAVEFVGSSSVVVSVDYKKNIFGRNKVYLNKTSKLSKFNVIDISKEAEELGAGEIMLCSVDREGGYSGYDLEMITKISDAIQIPLIASGGASSLGDFKKAIDHGASAATAGNLFIFRGKYKAVMISYPNYSELQSLF